MHQRHFLPLVRLTAIGAQVKPICVAHQWQVKVLEEFVPPNPDLLGMNVNRSKILIRLRPASDVGEQPSAASQSQAEFTRLSGFFCLLDRAPARCFCDNGVFLCTEYSLRRRTSSSEQDESCADWRIKGNCFLALARKPCNICVAFDWRIADVVSRDQLDVYCLLC